MIPRASQGIGHLITRIAQDLIPKATDAYAATDLAYVMALMSMIGQDYDRAADVLIGEHAAIVAILGKAKPSLTDDALVARIERAISIEPASLRIPDLNARADVTVATLIDVHAAVEDAEAAGRDWARELNLEIWAFLDRFVADRAYEVAF